jgi:hypothetical protein
MARYGYFFGDQAWLGKHPTAGGVAFDPAKMGEPVFQRTTKHGILIDHACDGLIVFDFKKYSPLASEEAQQELSRRSENPQMLDFESLSSFILRRTEIMNAHSICLKASIAAKQNYGVPATGISPHSVLHISDVDDPTESVGFKRQWDSYRYSARYISQYNQGLPAEFDPRVGHRFIVVSTDTLQDAADRLEKCVDKESDGALKLCGLGNLAVSSLEDHDYPRCLVTCWVVIEAFLNKKWKTYLNEGRALKVSDERIFINKNRFEKLTSTNYTASIIIENLSLLGKLSFEEYVIIEDVRKARNKWMHELKDVQLSSAQTALRAAAELFKSEFTVELPIGTGLRL